MTKIDLLLHETEEFLNEAGSPDRRIPRLLNQAPIPRDPNRVRTQGHIKNIPSDRLKTTGTRHISHNVLQDHGYRHSFSKNDGHRYVHPEGHSVHLTGADRWTHKSVDGSYKVGYKKDFLRKFLSSFHS